MKFSTALGLAIAPVALAKSVHNVYPARRHASKARDLSSFDSLDSLESVDSVSVDPAILEEAGLILGSLSEIVVIWVNGGGGVPTTTINAQAGATAAAQGISPLGGQVPPQAESSAVAAAGTPPAAGSSVSAGSVSAGSVSAGSSVSSAAGAVTTHRVTVGGEKGLIYEPATIEANVNDMVIFTFLSANHTATQSAFTTPCERLSGGMDTGFQPNPNNTVNPPPQVAMQVMVSTPLCK